MYKMQLEHPVIPDGKEAIRDDWSHFRDSGANLRTLPLAEVKTLQASIMTALNNTPTMFKSMSLQRLKTKDLQWPPLNMPINNPLFWGKRFSVFKMKKSSILSCFSFTNCTAK